MLARGAAGSAVLQGGQAVNTAPEGRDAEPAKGAGSSAAPGGVTAGHDARDRQGRGTGCPTSPRGVSRPPDKAMRKRPQLVEVYAEGIGMNW